MGYIMNIDDNNNTTFIKDGARKIKNLIKRNISIY